jgi:hypothetical protein
MFSNERLTYWCRGKQYYPRCRACIHMISFNSGDYCKEIKLIFGDGNLVMLTRTTAERT